jgi:phenylalanine-4-hydroxylase
VAETFQDAQRKVRFVGLDWREFSVQLDRPFSVVYNPFTETVELLDSKEKILRFAGSIQSEYSVLIDAIKKL